MYDRTRSEHVLQTNPNIQRYFDELTQRLGLQTSDLTLNNLLNRPIQRLEKYKHILQVKSFFSSPPNLQSIFIVGND
jgi:hypothetical protein